MPYHAPGKNREGWLEDESAETIAMQGENEPTTTEVEAARNQVGGRSGKTGEQSPAGQKDS